MKTSILQKSILIFCSLFLINEGPLSAQSEKALKQFFEGQMVGVRIDMPATSKGIDIFVNEERPLDFDEYSKRIKKHGISLFAGDQIMVTKIRLKKKHIEFQLGGGGYGTFGDESSHVSTPYLSKSEQEKQLEKEIKNTNDAAQKKKMQSQLRDLRKARELEQKRLRMEAEQTKAAKADRILTKAIQSGSRFNIRFAENIIPSELYPETLTDLLSEYLEFNRDKIYDGGTVIQKSPSEMRKGLLWEEVAVLLGAPSNIEQRKEGNLNLMICQFEKADKTITAEFIEGVLIRYSIQSK